MVLEIPLSNISFMLGLDGDEYLALSNSLIALSRVIFCLFVSKIVFELLPPVKSPTPHKANPQTSKTRKILKKID